MHLQWNGFFFSNEHVDSETAMLQLPLERWASIVPLLTKARDRRLPAGACEGLGLPGPGTSKQPGCSVRAPSLGCGVQKAAWPVRLAVPRGVPQGVQVNRVAAKSRLGEPTAHSLVSVQF